jgi:hypothetical protein
MFIPAVYMCVSHCIWSHACEMDGLTCARTLLSVLTAGVHAKGCSCKSSSGDVSRALDAKQAS